MLFQNDLVIIFNGSLFKKNAHQRVSRINDGDIRFRITYIIIFKIILLVCKINLNKRKIY